MTDVTFVRRHWLLLSLALLGVLVVALGLSAWQLRGAPADARQAQDELTHATSALGNGDAEVAWEHVHAAREHVDDVKGATHGPGGWLWSKAPLIGSGVSDARHLASAMDELTSALEVTEGLYPQVSGEESELLEKGSVHLGVLEEALGGLDEIGRHVREAEEHLNAVKGTNSYVGETTADARDTALAKVEPAVSTLDRLDPLLERLPEMLGGDGRKQYVVALMNQAEMKYSGGSTLTFSHFGLDSGDMKRGRVRDTLTSAPLFKTLTWPKVEGNTLAADGGRRITHASIAPSWSVAGEELLRPWDTITRMETDGVLALDMQAIAEVLRVAGPLEVPGFGEVNADNVVRVTSGDYDRFPREEQRRRKRLNRALIPAFMDRVFSGVDFVSTMRALDTAAKGRHLAFYVRDDEVREAMQTLGFAGDLSETEHDYLGFFTQNMVGSKADYFQAKSLKSDVRLRPDGSARVTLEATVLNEGPSTVAGDLSAYTDPTLDATYAAFLPKGAKVREAVAVTPTGEVPIEGGTQEFFGRSFLTHRQVLAAEQAATLRLTYDVPQAAVASGDALTYRLDVDPHPTVKAEQVDVTVRWPKGFSADELPEGWRRTPKGAARWSVDALPGKVSWSVTAQR